MTWMHSERRLSQQQAGLGRQQNEPPVDCRIEGRRRAADAGKYWTTWWRLGTSEDTSSSPEAAVTAGETEREASHHVLQNGMGKVLLCSLVLQLTQTKPYGWNTVPAELLAGGRLLQVHVLCEDITEDSLGDSLLGKSDMFGFTHHKAAFIVGSLTFGLSAFYYSVLEWFFILLDFLSNVKKQSLP